MKVSKSHIILALLGIVFVGGLFFLNLKEINKIDGIGGQRDENGCLAPAGYTFVESIGACARDWEIDSEDKRQAAKIAVEHFGFKKGLAVGGVEVLRCPGCFDVTLDRKIISLRNWEVSSVNELDLQIPIPEEDKEEESPVSLEDNFKVKAVY